MDGARNNHSQITQTWKDKCSLSFMGLAFSNVSSIQNTHRDQRISQGLQWGGLSNAWCSALKKNRAKGTEWEWEWDAKVHEEYGERLGHSSVAVKTDRDQERVGYSLVHYDYLRERALVACKYTRCWRSSWESATWSVGRKRPGLSWTFEISKFTPIDKLPPTWPHLLILLNLHLIVFTPWWQNRHMY